MKLFQLSHGSAVNLTKRGWRNGVVLSLLRKERTYKGLWGISLGRYKSLLM
jgi:hypothetical protein